MLSHNSHLQLKIWVESRNFKNTLKAALISKLVIPSLHADKSKITQNACVIVSDLSLPINTLKVNIRK